jgi:hypothetical protein
MNAVYYYKPRNRKGRAMRLLFRRIINHVLLFAAAFVAGMALATLFLLLP